MIKIRNPRLLSLFLSISFLVLEFNKALPTEAMDSCQYTSDVFLGQADSLLKLGNENEALKLYLKALDLSESFSSLQLPIFKKIGDVYLKKGEYQKAIDFFRKYEWMATQQVISSKGYMPDDGEEWWGLPKKETKALENTLREFGVYLNELEATYLGLNGKTIKEIAQRFIVTMVSKSYAENFGMWSGSAKKRYRALGNIDPLKMDKPFYGRYPDSVKIDTVEIVASDRAKVFVKEFGSKIVNDSLRKPFAESGVYNFTKETTGWKFNAFEY